MPTQYKDSLIKNDYIRVADRGEVIEIGIPETLGHDFDCLSGNRAQDHLDCQFISRNVQLCKLIITYHGLPVLTLSRITFVNSSTRFGELFGSNISVAKRSSKIDFTIACTLEGQNLFSQPNYLSSSLGSSWQVQSTFDSIFITLII